MCSWDLLCVVPRGRVLLILTYFMCISHILRTCCVRVNVSYGAPDDLVRSISRF